MTEAELARIRENCRRLFDLVNACATSGARWQSDHAETREYLAFIDANFPGKDIHALLAELDARDGLLADMALDAGTVMLEAERAVILRRIKDEPLSLLALEARRRVDLVEWIEGRGKADREPLPIHAARAEIDRLRLALRRIGAADALSQAHAIAARAMGEG